MRTLSPRLWPPALALLAAACSPPGAPGPGGTPMPSPGATPDRVGGCATRLAAFDEDKDGRWQPTELARWLYAHPAVPGYGPCASPRPTDPSGGRVVAQAVGTGVVEPQCRIAAEVGAIAERLDRDGDGALTAAEACALVGEQLACDDRFAAIDANRDGVIDLAELRVAAPPSPDNPLIGANPPPPEVTFQALDRDVDGRLTPGELCAFEQVVFALPRAADLSGAWTFGASGEPPPGPVFGVCAPGNGLRLIQSGNQITGEELVCGGPCYVPISLTGTWEGDRLRLVGTVPSPSEEAGRRITYDLRLDAASGHLRGTRDDKPYWAAPFMRVVVTNAMCPL